MISLTRLKVNFLVLVQLIDVALNGPKIIESFSISETHIKPGVCEHADFLIGQIKENRENFEKFRTRLSIVRSEKAAKEIETQNRIECDLQSGVDRGVSDLISEYSAAASTTSRSSQNSRTTGRSYRSSKNRRKNERKQHSIKEGSIYEEFALIKALHHIVNQTYAQRGLDFLFYR